MQRIEIEVVKRDPHAGVGSRRKAGKLPAVYYGAGGENIAVEVDGHEFVKLGLGSAGAHLIRFKSQEPRLNAGIALVREIQTHPVSGTPIHVDFLRLDLSKPVEAEVSLSFVGKPEGVVEGGILQPLRRALMVRALPDNLPSEIEVDVSSLAIHDSIHMADVVLPEGVEVSSAENFTLVTVVPPVVEVAAAEEGELEAGEEAAAAAAAGEAEADTSASGEES